MGRVTQGAALALKTRVALFAGTWAKYHQHRSDYQQLLQQAIDAATKVIDSGGMLYMKALVRRRAIATCLSMRAIIPKKVSSTVGTRRISATIAARALYIGDGEGRLPVSWQICIY